VASILVVLLLFFLGQNLHVYGMSAERRGMGEIEVVEAVKSFA
jgi:hypothetical protein